jgi:hypothetical protein
LAVALKAASAIAVRADVRWLAIEAWALAVRVGTCALAHFLTDRARSSNLCLQECAHCKVMRGAGGLANAQKAGAVCGQGGAGRRSQGESVADTFEQNWPLESRDLRISFDTFSEAIIWAWVTWVLTVPVYAAPAIAVWTNVGWLSAEAWTLAIGVSADPLAHIFAFDPHTCKLVLQKRPRADIFTVA